MALVLGADLGDPEVEELHHAVETDHDVVRGHITVHDAERFALGVLRVVRVVERCRDPGEDGHRDGGRDASLRTAQALEDRPERDPVDVLHRDEEEVVLPPEVVDGADVGVRELHRQRAFPLEEGVEGGIVAELVAEHLDDDGAHGAPRGLLGEEDLRHPAHGEASEHFVSTEL